MGNEHVWKQFEKLVAVIERAAALHDATVKHNDRIRDLVTGQKRQIDVSIRQKIGTSEILVIVECRKKNPKEDVTWIEQLETKRQGVGAAKAIAVSSRGFTGPAINKAKHFAMELRVLREITPDDIEAWLIPESMTHSAHEFQSLKCTVTLNTGATEVLDGFEGARFHHPLVNSPFTADMFVFFREMSDPDTFSGSDDFMFELDGQDPNLIPVPLGERKKEGGLSLLIGDDYVPVASLILEGSVKQHLAILSPDEGKHYAYGEPDAPSSMLSHYETEMFGLPVQIEKFTRQGLLSSASVTFPSGVRLPAQLRGVRLTEVPDFDITKLLGQPVILKIFEGQPVEGTFFDLPDKSFHNDEQRAKFNEKKLYFVEKIFLDRMRDDRKSIMLDDKMWRERQHFIPKGVIEYIDLRPSFGVSPTLRQSHG